VATNGEHYSSASLIWPVRARTKGHLAEDAPQRPVDQPSPPDAPIWAEYETYEPDSPYGDAPLIPVG